MIGKVDQSALKVNQGFIIGLLVLAFVTNSLWLIGFVGAIMVVGTIWPEAAVFKRIYNDVLLPSGLLTSEIVEEDPEPHRFAQGFGSMVIALAFFAMVLGFAALGWMLTWVVVVLAGLNLFLGFCAGCFVYYQLGRWGVPGFERSSVTVK